MVENGCKYKVYVCCNTYNHAAYITDALNGFVMQETNFPFVVCVIDDASTDGEQDVIRQYVNKNFDTDNSDVAYQRETDYAEITFTQHKTNKNCFLVVHYLKYNHYQHNISMRSYLDEWRNDSEYIALCEGDDYWTDPLKLQKQVDFLEDNLEFSMCFHQVVVTYEEGEGENVFAHLKHQEYTLNDIIRQWTVPTGSVLYRREVVDKIPCNKLFKYGDNVLVLTCLAVGRIFCIEGEMGVYRRHKNGWTMDKAPMEFYRDQFVHFHALVESFPMLDLSLLYGTIKSYAYYLVTFDDEMPLDIKKLAFYYIRKSPISFIYSCVKLKIKSFLSNVLINLTIC